MKKIFSLLKVSLNHDMNIFKIHTKKQNVFSKFILPIFFVIYIMFVIAIYAIEMMKVLQPLHLEFVVLTFFILSISLLTIIEGVYKSGSLLFNCKDDQLLFSLPLKKRTILFIRIFKFYTFELLYNSLFLLPVMIIYAYNIHPGWTYYVVSFISLFILPIIPIAVSCLIGSLVVFLSSKFKGKNIFQTVFTTLFLLVILYCSYNINSFINNLTDNAMNLNNIITKIYYPIEDYISLINTFDIKNFLLYIFIHLTILTVTVLLIGRVYFKINSSFKKVLIKYKDNHYVIKSRSQVMSFIRKELNRFFMTPVFITNAGFGLILFIIVCIVVSLRFDYVLDMIIKASPNMNSEFIRSQLPVLMFGLLCFTSFMTSITSSMISLESKSFNILKSLPIKPFKIVLYKVLSALLIMLPCIIIGDLIIFIRFQFDLISILLLLIATFLLPFISELIGILVNLKYPKLDATNDTEIVKQSMSSMISVFIGMGLIGLTGILLFKMLFSGLSSYIILLILILGYSLVALVLWTLLLKYCDKYFNNINV